MSRTTHDFECFNCGAMGKVSDDIIVCPECHQSIEGQAITGEILETLMAKIDQKTAERIIPDNKERKN